MNNKLEINNEVFNAKLREIENLIATNPNFALIKLRVLVEKILEHIIVINEGQVLDKKLKSNLEFAYRNKLIKEEWYQIFESIRIMGNNAVHESYDDLTIAKNLYYQLCEILGDVLRVMKIKDDGINYKLNSVIVKVNDFVNKNIVKFHMELIEGGFKYNYVPLGKNKITNDNLNRDMFETEDEFNKRINSINKVNIGIANIISFKKNVNYPILVQLDSSQGIKYPMIDGFFINYSSNIEPGNYQLSSKLRVDNKKVCIDTEKVYLSYKDEKIPVKLLITKRQESVVTPLDGYHELIVGDISFGKDSYNIEEQKLKLKLNVINSFKSFITLSDIGIISIERDEAKEIYNDVGRCYLKAKVKLNDFNVSLKELYLLYKQKEYLINIVESNEKKDYIAVRYNYEWGIINKKGEFITNNKYYEISKFSDGLARVSYENLYGYVDEEGKEVIKPMYESSGDFKDGTTYVLDNCRYYHINKNNEPLYNERYDDITEFSEEFAGVNYNGVWGYITKEGKVRIDFQYELVSLFRKGVAVVKKKGRFGVINKDNEIILPFNYDYCSQDFLGNFIVRKNELCGYFSLNGKEMMPVKYKRIQALNKDTFLVNERGQYKIIKDNNEVNLPQVDEVMVYKESNVLVIARNGKYGMIDYNGREIMKCKYDFFRGEMDGYSFSAILGGKWGIVDNQGNVIVDFLFDEIYGDSGNLILAKLDGKYGFIDRNCEIVIPFKYDYANNFKNGIAPVCINYRWGIIDINDKILIECKFQSIRMI